MDQTQTGPTGTPQAPIQPTPAPAQPKSKVWLWILGGCLGIAILSMIALVALGWWGARKVKREMQKYTPDMEQLKNNAEKWNKESEEWQKKSEEYRENMPSPEELESQMQIDPNSFQQ